jgi:hypothetical protein
MELDGSNCNVQAPCAWMDGSAAPTMAPYDIDPCGCSDEDNDAIGTRQLDHWNPENRRANGRLHYASGSDQTHIDPDDE